jgi:hypothetical protein
MEMTLLGQSMLVPAYLGVPFLAGLNFIQTHIAPWAIGIFFAIVLNSGGCKKSRLRVLLESLVFIGLAIVLLPFLVAVYYYYFKTNLEWSYGLALLSAYGFAWLAMLKPNNKSSLEKTK